MKLRMLSVVFADDLDINLILRLGSLSVINVKRPGSLMLRVAMAQIDSTVGDLQGNVEKINEYIRRAKNLSRHCSFSRVGYYWLSSSRSVV